MTSLAIRVFNRDSRGYINSKYFPFQISEEDILALASKWNLEYIETSAKTRMNVDKIFYDLMKKIHDQKKTTGAKQIPTKPVKNRSLKKSLSTFWKFLQGNCRK